MDLRITKKDEKISPITYQTYTGNYLMFFFDEVELDYITHHGFILGIYLIINGRSELFTFYVYNDVEFEVDFYEEGCLGLIYNKKPYSNSNYLNSVNSVNDFRERM